MLDGQHLLISLDGTQYFSAYAWPCANCLPAERRNGQVPHYHTAILPVLVAPAQPHVLPGPPEFIMPQEGHAQQDCERAASKRWVTQHLAHYREWQPLLLGEEVYAQQPLCTHILAPGGHFSFTCKPDSHVKLYTTLTERETEIATLTMPKWNGEHRELWRYRYCNAVPLRDSVDAFAGAGLALQITHGETGARLYQHPWVTDRPITEDNLVELVRCARAHWKGANENNNVLKNHGYQLAPNFGQGQQYLAATLLTLNLLAFLLHTVMHAPPLSPYPRRVGTPYRLLQRSARFVAVAHRCGLGGRVVCYGGAIRIGTGPPSSAAEQVDGDTRGAQREIRQC